MKFLIVIASSLMCAFFVPRSSCAQENPHNRSIVCLGFYNLENFYDTINDPNKNDEEFLPEGVNHYTGKVYKDKMHRLATVISQIGTEASDEGLSILGCAEVENLHVLQDLVKQKEIVGHGYKIVHYDSPDERGIDVAMLYNPKNFKVLFSEPLLVSLKNDDGSPRFTRDVLYVKGVLQEDTLNIFVNHWPSRRGGEEASAPYRAIAAGVCRHKIDSLFSVNKNPRIILMGDLNDDPVNESVTNVLNATGEIKKVSDGKLFNPWVDYYKSGVGTLAYNDSWNLFDQIILSPGLLNKSQKRFHFKEAKIFSQPWMIQQLGRYKGYPKRTYNFNKYAGGYSDHFPTYIILEK